MDSQVVKMRELLLLTHELVKIHNSLSLNNQTPRIDIVRI